MKFNGPSKYDLIAAGAISIVILIAGNSNLFDFENYPKRANGKELFTPKLYEAASGIITDKYLDKPHHAYKTIDLTINDGIERYFDLTLNEGIYDYVKISDSIITRNYGRVFIIRRDNKDSIFKLK